jgi:hypothetical protein
MDGKAAARYPEDWGAVEEFRKLLSIQGGAGDEELEIRPKPGNVLDQPEEDVRVQRPLVSLKKN